MALSGVDRNEIRVRSGAQRDGDIEPQLFAFRPHSLWHHAAMATPTNFEEFWPYYVSQHLDPTSRRLHFVGTTLALGCVAISPVAPAALLAAPVLGYGFAWVGHLVFEKNKPATWGGPQFAVWSLRGDLRMWKHMLTGQMTSEIERLETEAIVAAVH